MLVLGFFVRVGVEICLGFVVVISLVEVVGELVFDGLVVRFFCRMIGWGDLVLDGFVGFFLFVVIMLFFWWRVVEFINILGFDKRVDFEFVNDI